MYIYFLKQKSIRLFLSLKDEAQLMYYSIFIRTQRIISNQLIIFLYK